VFFLDLPDLASSVNDIQVQRGVGTSTNGAASFGGSINIETSRLRDKAYTELNSSYGSFNTSKNTLNFGTGKLKNNLSFDGKLSSILSDGYIDRASSNLKSAYLSGGYYGEKTIIKALVNIGKERTYQSWSGVPKELLTEMRTYNPEGEMYGENGEISGYYEDQVDDYQQNYYQLHIAHRLNNNLHINTSLFYTRGYGYYESYKDDEDLSGFGFGNVIIANDTISRTNLVQQKWLDNDYYGYNVALNYTTNKVELSIGEGWNQYVGDHFGMITKSDVEDIPILNKRWYDNTGSKTDYNFFFKTNYSVLDNLNLYGDLQYRIIDYKIEGTHDDLRDISQKHKFNFL
jgi:iron complex outermembrane receptor protein